MSQHLAQAGLIISVLQTVTALHTLSSGREKKVSEPIFVTADLADKP
jgi:hypothetical protein